MNQEPGNNSNTAENVDHFTTFSQIRIVANNIVNQEYKNIGKKWGPLMLPDCTALDLSFASLDHLGELANTKGLTTDYFVGLHLARTVAKYGSFWRDYVLRDTSKHLDAAEKLSKKHGKPGKVITSSDPGSSLHLQLFSMLPKFVSKDQYRKSMHNIYNDGKCFVATDGFKLAKLDVENWDPGFYTTNGDDLLKLDIDETFPPFRNIIGYYEPNELFDLHHSDIRACLAALYLVEMQDKLVRKYGGFKHLATVYSNVLLDHDREVLESMPDQDLRFGSVRFGRSKFSIEHLKPTLEYLMAYVRRFGDNIVWRSLDTHKASQFYDRTTKECVAIVMPMRCDAQELETLPVVLD